MKAQYQIDKRFEEFKRGKFDAIYMTYFIGLKKIEVIKNRLRQRKGHDIHLHFNSGNILIIDEKVRRSDWDDILIEYLSNKESDRPGWIYGNESHYLAYLFPKKGCYLVDTQKVKQWVENKNSFFWKCEDVESINEGKFGDYTTISKAIPIYILEAYGFIHRKLPVKS